MEQDKSISSDNNYIETEGDEKELLQFKDDFLNGKIKVELSTKSFPEITVRTNPKKILKKI